ncbi:MAG: PH domain-containing protein [Planctomycetes bacterium]|nr:PH domain-containing protein [Planctomycetota bacterium]
MLLTYYILVSVLTLVGFPFVFLPLYFKYHTLKYSFDDKGISMSWGILFRREIYLTYRRIQDIHMTRNLFHRWLGLAAVSIQTASGSSGAEMTIEGIPQPEKLRDFLYTQMRGARDEHGESDAGDSVDLDTTEDEVLTLLREIRDELKSARTRQGEET